jgi:membrane associated rhomboid family serine protease
MKIINRFTFNAPVTLTFALISLAVLCVTSVLGGPISHAGLAFRDLFTVWRSSLLDPLMYLRLFTHVLGHANLEHYIGNFMLILLLGPIVEEKYGSERMLVMIAATALVTGLIVVIFFPTIKLLGASGIVFMLIILSSLVNMQDKKIPITFVLVVVLYLGREVVNGIARVDNVSQMGHRIGGACGACFGFAVAKAKRGEGKSGA